MMFRFFKCIKPTYSLPLFHLLFIFSHVGLPHLHFHQLQMDLQLRNSIYQCNPRCSIEKRHPKNHSTTATTSTTAVPVAAAAAASPPLANTNDSITYTKSSLLERFERERGGDRQQRTNYLNETVSVSIIDLTFLFLSLFFIAVN